VYCVEIEKHKGPRTLSIFAQNLVLRREAMGWTQETLADESGVSASAIKAHEGDKRSPNLATIESYAGALKCTVFDLLVETSGAALSPFLAWQILKAFERIEEPRKRNLILQTLGLSLSQVSDSLPADARALVEEVIPKHTPNK
jgi:transcriptional regulator with XRE-family HTH domain